MGLKVIFFCKSKIALNKLACLVKSSELEISLGISELSCGFKIMHGKSGISLVVILGNKNGVKANVCLSAASYCGFGQGAYRRLGVFLTAYPVGKKRSKYCQCFCVSKV